MDVFSLVKSYWHEFDAYQQNFKGKDVILWTQDHSDIPIFAVAIYLLFIFQVPKVLTTHLNLKPVNAVWNLVLSIFSFFGLVYTVPKLVESLTTKGFLYTVCEPSLDWYVDGRVGLWVSLFIFSKIPELMDTVFLVLQGKNVIFLHWFHHVTVLLYCWHAFHNAVPPGLWFASMNYSVHSIMYLYYFLGLVGYRKTIKPIAPIITSLQLLQMVGGIVVTARALYQHVYYPGTCDGDLANLKLATAMYGSYFVLFALLFHNLYISPTKRAIKTGCPDIATTMNVSDASGFFHDQNTETKGKGTKKKQ